MKIAATLLMLGVMAPSLAMAEITYDITSPKQYKKYWDKGIFGTVHPCIAGTSIVGVGAGTELNYLVNSGFKYFWAGDNNIMQDNLRARVELGLGTQLILYMQANVGVPPGYVWDPMNNTATTTKTNCCPGDQYLFIFNQCRARIKKKFQVQVPTAAMFLSELRTVYEVPISDALYNEVVMNWFEYTNVITGCTGPLQMYCLMGYGFPTQFDCGCPADFVAAFKAFPNLFATSTYDQPPPPGGPDFTSCIEVLKSLPINAATLRLAANACYGASWFNTGAGVTWDMGYNYATEEFKYPLEPNIPPPTGWTGAEYLWPNVNATKYKGVNIFLGTTTPANAAKAAPVPVGYWAGGRY